MVQFVTAADRYFIVLFSLVFVILTFAVILFSVNTYYFNLFNNYDDPNLTTPEIGSALAFNGLLVAFTFLLIIGNIIAIKIYMDDMSGGVGKTQTTLGIGLGPPYQKAGKIVELNKESTTKIGSNRERKVIRTTSPEGIMNYFVVDACSNRPGEEGIFARPIHKVHFDNLEVVYNNINPNSSFMAGIIPDTAEQLIPNDALVEVFDKRAIGKTPDGFIPAKIKSLGVCGQEEKLVVPVEQLTREAAAAANAPRKISPYVRKPVTSINPTVDFPVGSVPSQGSFQLQSGIPASVPLTS